MLNDLLSVLYRIFRKGHNRATYYLIGTAALLYLVAFSVYIWSYNKNNFPLVMNETTLPGNQTFYTSNVKLSYFKKRDNRTRYSKLKKFPCDEKSLYLQEYLEDSLLYYGSLKNTTILCMGPALGRLGNSLFQYASLYGLAQHTQRTSLFDEMQFDKLFSFFDISNSVQPVNINNICYGLPSYKDMRHALFDVDLVREVMEYPRCDLTLGDYLQSWMYFYDGLDHMRDVFTIRTAYRMKAAKFVSDSLQISRRINPKEHNCTLIGVHVRRDDIENEEWQQFGLVRTLIEFYQNAMKYYKRRFGCVTFFVTSDDKYWVYEQFPRVSAINNFDVFISDNVNPAIDLAILQLCDHTIITSGTFSFWAAFLNGQEALYYVIPALPGTLHELDYTKHAADFYLPYWKAIS